MALKILDINPVVERVKETIEASGINNGVSRIKKVHTEADSLEILVGFNFRGGMEPFGRVTMDVPSGYLVVRTEDDQYTGKPCDKKYEKLIGTIAQNLAHYYEVTYVTPLTPENRAKEGDPGLL